MINGRPLTLEHVFTKLETFHQYYPIVECTCSVATVYKQCMAAHMLHGLCSVHCNYTT